jgi:hypothetical protein
MSLILKEIGVTAERPLRSSERDVENMSCVVCALLIRGLQRQIKTPDFWKILIRINFRDVSDEGKNLLGVLVHNQKFPSDEFVTWPIERRQDYMLKFVSEVTRQVFQENKLDISKLDDAIDYSTQKDFCNLIVGKKRFRNADSGEIAHIECEQKMDEAQIFAVFKKKTGSQKRIFVAADAPDEFMFQIYFGQIKWDEAGRAFLLTTNKKTIPIETD